MKKIKILIDTNVLISAALKDKIPEQIILYVAEHPEFEWIVSKNILEEYKSVLSRPKFALPKNLLNQWFEMLEKLTTEIDIDIAIKFPRDQKDAKFIECSLVSNASFFITGDKDFSEAHKMLNTTIISVSLFKKIVCNTYAET